MPTYHQPKPISFVPPILRRKFVMPDNKREQGTMIALVGLAVCLVTAGPTVKDLAYLPGKRVVEAPRVTTAPHRANLAGRMVGVYLFKDETGVELVARGDRVYTQRKLVPAKASVVWKAGRANKARVVFQYQDYLLGLPVGLAILSLGLWMRFARPARARITVTVTPGEAKGS